MPITVPPVATMMMISEAQCAVYSPNAGADGAAYDSSHGTCGSITSMGALLGAADQALRMRNHRRRHQNEKSKSHGETKLHKFSRG
jgi:hypothetical protein